MKVELENVKPMDIEKRSFEIITEEPVSYTHLDVYKRQRKAPEDGSVFMERTLFLQASRICITMEIPEYRRRF